MKKEVEKEVRIEAAAGTEEMVSIEPINTKESISINNSEKRYEIESIEQEQPNILKVVFSDIIPPTFGDIEVYTPGGQPEDCHLIGYDTVFQTDGQTVYLSNDGSVYVAPEIQEDK